MKKLTGNLVPSSSPPQLYNRSSARLAELYGHESEGDEGDETPRWVSDRVLQTCSAALFVMATTTFLLNPHPFPACLGSKQHRTYASSVQPQLLRRPFLVLLTSTDLTPVLPPPVQEYATNISCFTESVWSMVMLLIRCCQIDWVVASPFWERLVLWSPAMVQHNEQPPPPLPPRGRGPHWAILLWHLSHVTPCLLPFVTTVQPSGHPPCTTP